MYLLAPFILQNFKKNLRANPELWGGAIFRTKMAHLSLTKFFWYKPLLLLSSTYSPFSLCKILKNSYSGSRALRMCHFWAQNGPPFAPYQPPTPNHFHLPISPKMVHFPKWEFFFSENLLMSLVSFNHAHLHAKNQSHILVY